MSVYAPASDPVVIYVGGDRVDDVAELTESPLLTTTARADAD